MKKAPGEEGADHRANGKNIVPRGLVCPNKRNRNPCPFALECRTRWIHISGTETATCAHCYQQLERADLARILAGRS